MTPDWTISDWTRHWTTVDWTVWTITAVAAVVLIGGLVRALAKSTFEERMDLFTGVVQIGMAWTIVHGTFVFFRRIVELPTHEAWITAGVIEAVMWVGAGMVVVHGRRPNTVGWGYGGPLFIAAGAGGAILAVLASEGIVLATGRIVVVVLGMWTLTARLLRVTRRAAVDPNTPSSRWSLQYWRARRSRHNPDEWETRRLARAIRWANSYPPLAWLGAWLFTRRAEKAKPRIVAAAYRRAAMVYSLRSSIEWTSPHMVQILEEAHDWTRSIDGVLSEGPDRSDRSGITPDPGPVRALDYRPDPRSDRLPDYVPDHGPDHGPDPLDSADGPDRSGDPELSDLMRAKVDAIIAHVGKDWPDVTFSGEKIRKFKLPGIRSKDTCNLLAPILNRLAQAALADRMAPLIHND